MQAAAAAGQGGGVPAAVAPMPPQPGGQLPPVLAPQPGNYLDLYLDPTSDAYSGNYVNLYQGYTPGATTPQDIRNSLYRDGSTGAFVNILVHVRDPAADPDDPGKVVAYHRLTRKDPRFGQPPLPYETLDSVSSVMSSMVRHHPRSLFQMGFSVHWLSHKFRPAPVSCS